jgi:hypothetical protein
MIERTASLLFSRVSRWNAQQSGRRDNSHLENASDAHTSRTNAPTNNSKAVWLTPPPRSAANSAAVQANIQTIK